MLPSIPRMKRQEIATLILNHLDTLLANLYKYFPAICAEQYNWVRNPFVEFGPPKNLSTLTEEKGLASISTDRTLKLKHCELSLDEFWKKEYPAVAQKALRVLVQFSTPYWCELGFSALTTIKHKKRAYLLSLEVELCVSL